MNAYTRFASFAAMLLIGIASLSSCAVGPEPDSPAASQPPTAAQSRETSQPLSVPRSRAASQPPSPAPPGLHALPSAIVTADSVMAPDIEPLAEDEELWIIARGSSAGHSPGATGARGMARARSALGFAGGASVLGMTRSMERARTKDATADRERDREPDMDPGPGAMMGAPPGETRHVPLPLQHTSVDASVDGHVGTVQVRQQFENPFDAKIEAVYVFPLPERAAVSEFLMVIGDRTIRGIVREKEEAEAIYHEARAQGYRASLLVQRRPNIFEQKVANIEPGRGIEVDITYFHTLRYRDGWYSFVFPMVVGPRYNPPGHADPIGAVPRGGRTEAPDGTAVEYLAPDERSGHDIGIRVRIDAGVTIEEVRSSHEIATVRDRPETAGVTLAEGTTIPNRDFVLDFRVAGRTIKSNLLTYTDGETGDGFFTLMLIPPLDAATVARRPMEMVFVIDCSGSMDGRPLQQAKAAVATALDRLAPTDTFQIIRFSDRASRFGRAPVPATGENVAAARRYLSELDADGGTQMIEGIRGALDFPHSGTHFRFVSFLTDGYIGNESEILVAVHRRVGASRIFSFGVGDSVNRYLMERMAKAGRGVAAYLGFDDSAEDVMGAFFDRVSRPALTDIEIDWGGMEVSETYPAKLPDLFVGRPLVVAGKFRGRPREITVSGMAGESRRTLTAGGSPGSEAGRSIAKVWARSKIADLADRQIAGGDPDGEIRDAITRVALRHQLASSYTSFIAVDSSRRTEGSHGVTVHQAVPIPAGVRYDTTVRNRREDRNSEE